jgi:hypothetical protein
VRIAYYLDEHLPKAVAKGLRARGVDVFTVPEAGLLGASDLDQLAFALREERSIVTQDDDFLRLHASGSSHAGIVFAPRGHGIGAMISGLMLIHDLLTPEDMRDHVEFL